MSMEYVYYCEACEVELTSETRSQHPNGLGGHVVSRWEDVGYDESDSQAYKGSPGWDEVRRKTREWLATLPKESA